MLTTFGPSVKLAVLPYLLGSLKKWSPLSVLFIISAYHIVIMRTLVPSFIQHRSHNCGELLNARRTCEQQVLSNVCDLGSSMKERVRIPAPPPGDDAVRESEKHSPSSLSASVTNFQTLANKMYAARLIFTETCWLLTGPRD